MVKTDRMLWEYILDLGHTPISPIKLGVLKYVHCEQFHGSQNMQECICPRVAIVFGTTSVAQEGNLRTKVLRHFLHFNINFRLRSMATYLSGSFRKQLHLGNAISMITLCVSTIDTKIIKKCDFFWGMDDC